MKLEQIKNIKIADFDYKLPSEKIANYPIEPRDSAKLLIWKQNQIQDSVFSSLADWLPETSLLVVNNTKVISARLLFQTQTGANIEIFCLEPDGIDLAAGLQLKRTATWKCLIGNQKRWKDNEVLVWRQGSLELTARRVESSTCVLFEWNTEQSFWEILEQIGNVPLPPYIKRAVESTDRQTYQTVYARNVGAVAAPTAGLHFTDAVFESLAKQGIQLTEITLHVGAGTFLPVTAETIGEHVMHTEEILVSQKTLQQLASANWITVVGTTSLRTLESIYWLGVQAMQTKQFETSNFEVGQWLPYEWEGNCPPAREVFSFLAEELHRQSLSELHGKTRLLIAPGIQLHTSNALITNFHQPQSTLLLLVSAYTNGHWETIYKHALSHSYRFLSYGDSSLLVR
ncbi:MAG: S-adenosylmethionine:tRNA ribosyltransferase-isomerase [Bacteroidia bacterium]|nr:S-adenosylmethionine:tRNA ribosyltransferase-isomerase [Bacteroidia bacterium]